jgi:hypothetical protein
MDAVTTGYRLGLRQLTVGAIAIALMGTALFYGPQAALGAGAPKNTPPRELTVITANVDKAYGQVAFGNIHDMRSIKDFVTRALQVTPYYPDVVLMQEVRKEGARAAAKSFSRKTGQKYIIAVVPGDPATTQYGNFQLQKQVSILINTTTMRKASRGAFIIAKYHKYQAAPGHKVKWEKSGYVYLKELNPASGKPTGNEYAIADVHFTPPKDLKSKALSNKLRKRWSKQIVTKLRTKFPNASMTEIGGDWNMIRCSSGSFASCVESKFWHYFTTHGFVDSLYSVQDPSPGVVSCMLRMTGVDYIFTDKQPIKGDEDSKGGYSDHKLRWTVSQVTPYNPC